MLQEACVQNDRFENAFEISIKLDSLTGSDGRQLFEYLRHCRDRKLYDQVIKIAEYIEGKNVNKDAISEYIFYYAEALKNTGRSTDALLSYEYIVRHYPQERDRATALLEIGNIYRYAYNDFDSARVYYDSVANSYRIGTINVIAWVYIAEILMVAGNLDSAEAVYKSIRNKRHSEAYREMVAYNLGMIAFYKKNYEDADLAFRKLVQDYPRGFYVNNALINSLIIGESFEVAPEALSEYSDALYFDERSMPDSVEVGYKNIIDMGLTPLTGLSYFKLAFLYAEEGDTARALETIGDMEAAFIEDYFYPYALKLKADILLKDDELQYRAVEIYKRLLDNFDTYPFMGEIREVLQKRDEIKPAS
jgi:tetratricopeptide (TPR) repeat protein